MQFTLQTLMITFVVVGAALAIFGYFGLFVLIGLLGFAGYWRSFRFMSAKVQYVWGILGKWYGVLCCLLLFSAFAVLSAGPSGPARSAARRASCINREKQIGISLIQYMDSHGSLPPAFVTDASARPLHSWRTLILPELEYDTLFKKFRMNEPWDSQYNRTLLTAITEFMCPSVPDTEPRTHYVAVVGPNTAWPGATPRKRNELPDGGKNTILVIEIRNSEIPWTEPRDVNVAEAIRALHDGPHDREGGFFFKDSPGQSNVIFADGHVETLPANVPDETLEAMLTIDKNISRAEIDTVLANLPPAPRELRWDNLATLALLIISYAVLVFRPIRRAEAKQETAASAARDSRLAG